MADITGQGSAVDRERASESPVLRSLVFISALLLVWISTAPFKGGNVEEPAASNVVNQLAFSLMAAISIATLFTMEKRVLAGYWRPAWALLMGWIVIGLFLSNNPEVSLRAFFFLSAVIVIAAAAVVMPLGRAHFTKLLGGVVLGLLLLNYFGVIALPNLAIHSAGDRAEPEHAGSWRGLYDHKNIAGSMMGIFFFAGLLVFRQGMRFLGAVIAVLALGFLLNTASKTATGVTPAIFLFWLLSTFTRSGVLKTLILLAPLALMLTMTLGSVLFAPVNDILQAVSPGQSFTGRTELWRFALDRLGSRALAGFGLEGFWGSSAVRFAEMGENETGISNEMVHGHNSFLDSAINFGLIGFCLVMLNLVVLPMKDFLAARRFPENGMMADLMVQIWLFALYSACLESFFFRRADPVWFALLFAVVFLRFLALFRIRA